MKFDPSKRLRASTRLRDHDYALAGAYFITIVAYQREHLFGEIVDEDSRFVVGATGQSPLRVDNLPRGPKPKLLSSFVVGFKSSVTKRILGELNESGIWQRNYHDCIIRNEKELGEG